MGVKLTIHLRLLLRSRMVELYLLFPVCPYGILLHFTVKYLDNFTLPIKWHELSSLESWGCGFEAWMSVNLFCLCFPVCS
jgi:hypothetical protein